MRKTEDLTGKKFGLLTVLSKTDEVRGSNTVWECRCDCGNIVRVRGSSLSSGNTRSCGCLRRKNASKDLTGKRFGNLTAVRPTDRRQSGNIIWECACDCGKTALVSSANLISGRIRSCGCLLIRDLTGQRFGKLTAIRVTDERQNTQTVWECVCDCGNTVFVRSSNLVTGITRSCGCLLKAELTGQRFGKLTALRPTEERQKGNVVWECRCDCGNTAYVAAANLMGNRIRSCGCLKKQSRAGSDIAGQKFGSLTAVRPTEQRLGTSVVWECVCDCGKTTFASRGNLITGKSRSCGCSRKWKNAGSDIAGQRFGSLTAIQPTEERKNGSVVWECRCDCGKTMLVSRGNLIAGKIPSCSCQQEKERSHE